MSSIIVESIVYRAADGGLNVSLGGCGQGDVIHG